MKPPTNWPVMHELMDRAERIYTSGSMDHETWHGLFDEAYAAAGGNGDLCDWLAPYAKPGWLRDLMRGSVPAQKSPAA